MMCNCHSKRSPHLPWFENELLLFCDGSSWGTCTLCFQLRLHTHTRSAWIMSVEHWQISSFQWRAIHNNPFERQARISLAWTLYSEASNGERIKTVGREGDFPKLCSKKSVGSSASLALASGSCSSLSFPSLAFSMATHNLDLALTTVHMSFSRFSSKPRIADSGLH